MDPQPVPSADLEIAADSDPQADHISVRTLVTQTARSDDVTMSTCLSIYRSMCVCVHNTVAARGTVGRRVNKQLIVRALILTLLSQRSCPLIRLYSTSCDLTTA